MKDLFSEKRSDYKKLVKEFYKTAVGKNYIITSGIVPLVSVFVLIWLSEMSAIMEDKTAALVANAIAILGFILVILFMAYWTSVGYKLFLEFAKYKDTNKKK